MSVEIKINTLKSLLPASPFVVEQVGYALKFAEESYLADDDMEANLNQAIKLAELANKFSNKNFYDYRPIVTALLLDVTNEDNLSMFATETNSVLSLLEEARQYIVALQNNKNTKDCAVMFAKAVMEGKKDLVLFILTLLANVVEFKYLASVLKVAYLTMDMRLNKFEFTGAEYEAYNKLLKALNKAEF